MAGIERASQVQAELEYTKGAWDGNMRQSEKGNRKNNLIEGRGERQEDEQKRSQRRSRRQPDKET